MKNTKKHKKNKKIDKKIRKTQRFVMDFFDKQALQNDGNYLKNVKTVKTIFFFF